MRALGVSTHSLSAISASLLVFFPSQLADAQTAGPTPGCPTAPEAATTPAVPAQICQRLIPAAAAADAHGLMHLRLARSPFGVTVTEEGRYVYDIEIEIHGLRSEPGVTYTMWAITPEMDRRVKLGFLQPDHIAHGQIDWNRFMIVVTAESSVDVDAWSGPILFSASSPSGKLQTMAGEEILWNNDLPVSTRYCLVNKC